MDILQNLVANTRKQRSPVVSYAAFGMPLPADKGLGSGLQPAVWKTSAWPKAVCPTRLTQADPLCGHLPWQHLNVRHPSHSWLDRKNF